MSLDSLAQLLAMIEQQGSAPLASRRVETLAAVDARAALHAAGVLASAQPLQRWRCDERASCGREIQNNYDGARKPLVAVCAQSPAGCPPMELSFEDVSQQHVSVEALLAAVCALLKADADPAALAAACAVRPVGGARTPDSIAAARARKCDVFWAASPRDTDLRAFCAARERVTRRTLVLVPTAKHVAPDLILRYVRRERVELLALADTLAVRDGALVFLDADANEEPTAPAPSRGSDSSAGLAAALGATEWEQIRITPLDGQTVRLESHGKALLRSFVELGFVDRRKTETVSPTVGWSIFLLMCRTGRFMPSSYRKLGQATFGAKKGVESVRDALRAAFGLEANPLREYSAKTGWVPRFLVAPAKSGAEEAEEESAMMPRRLPPKRRRVKR